MRKWRLKEYAVVGLLVWVAPLFGGQCHIEILSQKNSGEKIRIKFNSKLRTQKQCQALAKMHRPNFNPDQVKLKLVNYKWIGPATHLLAKKVKHSKRRRLPKF